MTKKDAAAISKQFSQEYMFRAPWSDYIVGTGLSRVGLIDEGAPQEEKEQPCVTVYLKKEMPNALRLPDRYKGLRVCVVISGEFLPL